MKIQVHVTPKSSLDKIEKIDDTHYKVKVTAVPEKGKANKKVVELLAKHFKVSKSQVDIIRGTTVPDKLINIQT